MKEYNATLIDYGDGKGKLLVKGEFGTVTFAVKADSHMWVELEKPHGEWIKGREISRTMLCDKTLHIDYENFTCSVCGLVLDRLLYHVDGSPFYNFCPNCGADMRKEGEAE